MVVHFPIAFVVGTLGADLMWWFGADAFWLRVGIWAAGLAFLGGVAAAIAGTAELVLVKGIRIRVGRSRVTLSGVVLGIAFLMSNLTSQLVKGSMAAESESRQAVKLSINKLSHH